MTIPPSLHRALFAVLPAVAVIALAAIPGCDDDDDNLSADASPVSTPPEQVMADAAPPAGTCDAFCADLARLCPNESAEIGDCATVCADWAASVLQCRVEHVSYAIEGAVHCLHAIGDASEPSTPPECIE